MSEQISPVEVLVDALAARVSAHEVIFLAFLAAISASEEQVRRCRSMLETILKVAEDDDASFLTDKHRETLHQLAKRTLESLEKAQQREAA